MDRNVFLLKSQNAPTPSFSRVVVRLIIHINYRDSSVLSFPEMVYGEYPPPPPPPEDSDLNFCPKTIIVSLVKDQIKFLPLNQNII